MVHPITVIPTIGFPTCRGWHPTAGATRTVRRVRRSLSRRVACAVSGIDAQSPWNDVTMSSWEHGLRTDNAYYQAVGYFSGSMMADYDSHGYYWSATMDPSTGQAYGFDFTQTAIKPSALIPGLLCLSRPLCEGVVRSGESLVTARRNRRAVFLYVFAGGVYPRVARVDASAYLRFIFG